MKKIGYARVSTSDQNPDLQIAALKAAGCTKIFSDLGVSGAEFQRDGLSKALKSLRNGDMLVVWRLDRLGRSLVELVRLVNELGQRKVEFNSLSEAIDTSSSGGRLLFHLLAAMAEFERSLISERTKAGMSAARARGSQIGRRPAMTDEERRDAHLVLKEGSATVDDIAKQHNIHPRTLLRIMKREDCTRNTSI